MTTIELRIVLYGLLAVALGAGAMYVSNLREASALSEQRGTTLQTTSAVIDDGTIADQAQAAVVQGIAAGRDQFNNTYSEAKRNEPTVADRANRPVPASVRNAYRERRLARERYGCVRSECQARGQAGDAAER